MRVESSAVSYAASHRLESRSVVTERELTPLTPPPQDSVRLSNAGASFSVRYREDLAELDPKQLMALLAIEAILGHKVKFVRGRGGPVGAEAGPPAPRANAGAAVVSAAPASAIPASAAPASAVRERTELHAEWEQMRFRASGSVQTGDGRSISFEASLTMERGYVSLTRSVIDPKATDPLVVNFGGGPARLTSAKVLFDLNGDGAEEPISFVAAGSGFLALDGNGDGQINDGGELFGPASGNGFAELAAYDSDGSGWIDEGDAVFSDLRIWSVDGLRTLEEHGIGAIATASAETPFAIKDQANRLQGNVRASGVYLAESGQAGTVQQVDLVTE